MQLIVASRSTSRRKEAPTHPGLHLLQGVEGGDVGMCHGSSHGDPKQEASLNITREIKAWKAGCAVTLQTGNKLVQGSSSLCSIPGNRTENQAMKTSAAS